MTQTHAVIEVNQISKAFDGHTVLADISLSVQAGELVAVIGESGCGKSVLLKHINGLLTPDSGTISVLGKPVSQLSASALKKMRRKIGLVFQQAALFDSCTVAENMAVGAHWQGRLKMSQADNIEKVLKRVGLEGIGNMLPASLSGGMKKRVGIARALMMKPELMLYDEPTTGLDPPRAWAIMDLIHDINRQDGVTSVVVTHDLSRLDLFNRVLMLHRGNILFNGTPADLLARQSGPIGQFIKRAALSQPARELCHDAY